MDKYLIFAGGKIATESSCLSRAKEYAAMAASEAEDSLAHVYKHVTTAHHHGVVFTDTSPKQPAKKKPARKAISSMAKWTKDEDDRLLKARAEDTIHTNRDLLRAIVGDFPGRTEKALECRLSNLLKYFPG
jgi:hypothetical protein